MSTPNPVLVAAAPALVSILQSLKGFVANLGTDPAQVAIKFPGALQILLGQVELQLPAVAQAEFGAGVAAADAKIDALIASVQKHAS